MGLLVLVLWAVVACALPDAMPARLAVDRHAPDLFVALAAYLAARGSGLHVVRWGILLGALKDCASLDPLGTHAFVLGATTLLFARSRDDDDQPAPSAPSIAISVALATLVANVLYAVRLLPMHRDAPGALRLVVDAFPTALWTALASWPLLSILTRTGAVDDLLGRRRARAA